jgi:hypothetical protein
MKKLATLIAFLAGVLFCQVDVRAQETPKDSLSQAPILPMNVKFRFTPQYFVQSLDDDPRYARIEALIDGGRCDVVLMDKTMNRRAYYSNLQRKVDALAANGADAYATSIDFAALSTDAANPIFRIRLQDSIGQEIVWQFVASEILPHSSPEVVSRSDNSGIALIYAPRRASALPGTSLTIGGRKYTPKPSDANSVSDTFYAIDMTIAQILPGTELWSVETSPASLTQTAKWNLRGGVRRERMLVVKQLYDTEAVVDQIDLYDPDSPELLLNVTRTNVGFSLRSMSITSHSNTLWIFFGPELPLPVHGTDDKMTVTFTVAENEQASIATGTLAVRRALEAEHIVWQFDAPDLARGEVFETGANVIPNSGEQSKCVMEDCSARSPRN